MWNRLVAAPVILGSMFSSFVGAAELQVPGSFPTLQAAIDAAVNGDIVTVANGSYSGDGNRDLDFSGKAITVRSAKGPTQCTINCGGTESESHRGFIFENGEDVNSIVDGFTITNGYRSGGVLAGSGGAIYCSGAGPTIRNCIITGNVASGNDTAGGGIICRDQAHAVIENCTITNNQAGEHGGGIRCSESNVIIRNCVITDNVGMRENSWGGGISIFNCRPEISNCVISNNSAEKDGGGIYSSQGIGPLVTQCTLQNNVAGNRGGGIYSNLNTGVTITDCNVRNNDTQSGGGGMYFNDSDPNVISCLVQGNTAGQYGGGMYANECTVTVRDGLVTENAASTSNGGGLGFGFSDAVVENVVIMNNSAAEQGGGLDFYEYGGAATLTMNRCRIVGNRSDDAGAGIHIGSPNAADISNTLIAGNLSPANGGGIYVGSAQLTLRNCTISGNRAVNNYGGGLSCWSDSEITMRNCVVWGNEADNGDNLAIRGLFGPVVAAIANSCIEGGESGVDRSGDTTLDWYESNLASEPNFVSPGYRDDNDTPELEDDIWVIGEYHLLPGSECIDTGDPNGIAIDETDLAGNDRIAGADVDMGAYENDPTEIGVTKVTVKADKDREDPADTCTIAGNFVAAVESFLAADTVSLRTGTWYETLSAASFQQSGKKAKYTYKGPSGGITSMTLDFIKGIFTASGKGLSLTGTTAPVPVALVMGDYYGYAMAADKGANDVINSKKSLPVQLLAGYADTLQVTKIKAKEGPENYVASLTIQGTLTSIETVDLRASGLTIHWGTDSYTIADEYFTEKGTYKYVGKKKSFIADPTSVNATIDFIKCTFKIVLKNTELSWQDSPLDFGLEFGTYYKTVSVILD